MAKFGTTLSRLTFGQMYPLIEPSGQVDILSDLQVRLTFGQMYPLVETSCEQLWYYFKQAEIWSDVPPVDTSHGQVWYYFEQADFQSDVPPW